MFDSPANDGPSSMEFLTDALGRTSVNKDHKDKGRPSLGRSPALIELDKQVAKLKASNASLGQESHLQKVEIQTTRRR